MRGNKLAVCIVQSPTAVNDTHLTVYYITVTISITKVGKKSSVLTLYIFTMIIFCPHRSSKGGTLLGYLFIFLLLIMFFFSRSNFLPSVDCSFFLRYILLEHKHANMYIYIYSRQSYLYYARYLNGNNYRHWSWLEIEF